MIREALGIRRNLLCLVDLLGVNVAYGRDLNGRILRELRQVATTAFSDADGTQAQSFVRSHDARIGDRRHCGCSQERAAV